MIAVRTSRILGLICAVAFAAACSSSDNPTDPGGGDGGDGGETPTRTVKASPSFASDIQEIFDRRGCSASSCHGSLRSAGLDLRAANSYANLVGVQASSEPIVRVIPNDADGSYLVIKLEGRQSVGDRMPALGGPLDAIDLANIKNWINTGAPNN